MPEPTRDSETARTIIVRLTPETHKALRIRVAEEDTSIQKWVESLIERTLNVGRFDARDAADRPEAAGAGL
jgi:predicted HicB family RNase H-like nuclease